MVVTVKLVVFDVVIEMVVDVVVGKKHSAETSLAPPATQQQMRRASALLESQVLPSPKM